MTWVPLVSGMQQVYFVWHSFSATVSLSVFTNPLCFNRNTQNCLLIGHSNPSQCIRQEVWYLQLFLWVLYMTMSVSCNKNPAVTHDKLKGYTCTFTFILKELLEMNSTANTCVKQNAMTFKSFKSDNILKISLIHPILKQRDTGFES